MNNDTLWHVVMGWNCQVPCQPRPFKRSRLSISQSALQQYCWLYRHTCWTRKFFNLWQWSENTPNMMSNLSYPTWLFYSDSLVQTQGLSHCPPGKLTIMKLVQMPDCFNHAFTKNNGLLSSFPENNIYSYKGEDYNYHQRNSRRPGAFAPHVLRNENPTGKGTSMCNISLNWVMLFF